jgi:hypothetical protein
MEKELSYTQNFADAKSYSLYRLRESHVETAACGFPAAERRSRRISSSAT